MTRGARGALVMSLLAIAACGRDAAPPMALRVTFDVDTGSLEVVGEVARVMQKRLDRVHAHGTARADGGRVIVELPALDPERMMQTKQVIVRRGQFAMRVVDDGAAVMRAIGARVADDPDARQLGIEARRDRWHDDDGNSYDDVYLRADDRDDDARRGVVPGRDVLTSYAERLRDDPETTIPDDHALAFERIVLLRQDDRPPYWRSYYVVRDPFIDGRRIAGARRGFNRNTDSYSVLVRFDGRGERTLAKVTRAHRGHKVTLEIDDVVSSAPVIMSALTSGRTELLMAGGTDDDRAAADQLAVVLASGPLPAAVAEASVEQLR